jgi:hypothetical protein
MKKEILNSMIELVKEGQTITTTNENDFSEFANVNGYDEELVEEVYFENEDLLISIFNKNL